MREIKLKNRDQQDLNTGHASFDNQVSILTTGNIISGTQFGNYIRPYETPTNPIGMPCEPGAMQQFDLDSFKGLPAHVRRCVEENGRTELLNLHQFHHSRDGNRIVHGYVLTKGHAGLHELIKTFVTGPTRKSHDVIATVTEYVSNPPGTLARVQEIGAGLADAADLALTALPDEVRGAFDEVLDALAQHEEALSDGARVIRHLADRAVSPSPRTEEGKEAADVVEAIAARSDELRIGLANASATLQKEIIERIGAEIRPEGSAVDAALCAMLRARHWQLSLAPTPQPA